MFATAGGRSSAGQGCGVSRSFGDRVLARTGARSGCPAHGRPETDLHAPSVPSSADLGGGDSSLDFGRGVRSPAQASRSARGRVHLPATAEPARDPASNPKIPGTKGPS